MSINDNFQKIIYTTTGIQTSLRNEINSKWKVEKIVQADIIASTDAIYTIEYKMSDNINCEWFAVPEFTAKSGNLQIASNYFGNVKDLRINITTIGSSGQIILQYINI